MSKKEKLQRELLDLIAQVDEIIEIEKENGFTVHFTGLTVDDDNNFNYDPAKVKTHIIYNN